MVPNGHPLVTVLTPVYNGEDYFAECIESVLKQTYQNFEYIIVNNCSTDRSLQIAQEYAAKDSRIRVHNNETFVGVIDNHNLAFGLISPSAKYCKVVSADDFIFPDCILRMVDFAEANPAVGLVGAYQLSGSVVKWQGFNYPTQVFHGIDICRQILFQRQVFVDGEPIFGFGSPTSLLYRADLVRNSDHFYPNASPHSDTSACLRDLVQSDFGFVYQILSFERTHEKTQTSTSVEMYRHASAYLSDLIDYGPHYLSKEELRKKIDDLLRAYHRFLAANMGAARGKNFWDYHKGRLKELGYPLTRWALFKGFIAMAWKGILNPAKAVRKLSSRVSPRFQTRSPQPQTQQVTPVASSRKPSGTNG